jgi:exosortase/archaeosortase family protein
MKKLKNSKILKKIIRFLIIFNLLAIPMYLIMLLDLSFTPLQVFLTDATYKTLNFLGYQSGLATHPLCNTEVIKTSTESICISWDSTGWKSMYILAALAIATPVTNYKKKLVFLAIGLPLVFLVNFLRIVTTITISLKFGFQYFELLHTILWREVLILLVVGIWLVWLWKEKHNIT